MNKKRLTIGSAILAATIAVVGGFEGLRTHAYRDVTGVPTVCFGETRGVQMGDSYTVSECKSMLGDRLMEFEAKIDACLADPKSIPDKSYIASISLAYNIGAYAFCHSTVARKLNAKDYRGACDAFLMWDKAGGRVVRGLQNRRVQERKLCLEGIGEK